ncbi:enoyl-CoA hydratase/isomerase family protein [Specibacter sp. NPDC057265]|uniref:enoyl-CoA hydratase/isomerase family protein n=1 Tax=Specibacter sp. NPDC057265 TaxID=3346075 RepID=UPI00363FB1D5
MENNEVLVERTGQLGHVLLNRPQAMNALNHGMIRAIAAALDEWEHDASVATVLISGAGERGLCAGGDVVSIYHDARRGGQGSEQFWRDEYTLNARIHSYPKPMVAFMDGVVLGGGVGISAHARHRIVTERSRIGMPETGIGFVPDVGGSYLLARAPGETGTHAALTGTMVSGADAIAMGLAGHYVHSSRLPTLVAELAHRSAAAVTARWGQQPSPSELEGSRAWIDQCYGADDAGTILARLARHSDPRAVAAGELIAAKSPTAVTVALAALRRARGLGSLEEGLAQDLRVSLRAVQWPDFSEGIRAQLVDKDRNPQWLPAQLADVSAQLVADAFAPLGARELKLPAAAAP